MAYTTIAQAGELVAVLVPEELRRHLDWQIGDQVELFLENESLVIRPLPEQAEVNGTPPDYGAEDVDSIVAELFAERREAYLKLAEGSANDSLPNQR
jgi:antitoxin component of MazEF toxin-antitoxin module